MDDIRQCHYPDCATWQAVGQPEESHAGLWLCRADAESALGLCSRADMALHAHLMFANTPWVTWPGNGTGDFYLEDNVCDRDGEVTCYLRNTGCGANAQSLQWLDIDALSGCASSGSCELWRYWPERVLLPTDGNGNALYRLRSDCGQYLGGATGLSSGAAQYGLHMTVAPPDAVIFRPTCDACPSYASPNLLGPTLLLLVVLFTSLLPSMYDLGVGRRCAAPRPARPSGDPDVWPTQQRSLRSQLLFQAGWAWAVVLNALGIFGLYFLWPHDPRWTWCVMLSDLGVLIMFVATRPDASDLHRLQAMSWLFMAILAFSIYMDMQVLVAYTDLRVMETTWLDSDAMQTWRTIAIIARLASTTVMSKTLIVFGALVGRSYLSVATRHGISAERLYHGMAAQSRACYGALAVIALAASVGAQVSIKCYTTATAAEVEYADNFAIFSICFQTIPLSVGVAMTHPRMRVRFHLSSFASLAMRTARSLEPPTDLVGIPAYTQPPTATDNARTVGNAPEGATNGASSDGPSRSLAHWQDPKFATLQLAEEIGHGGYGTVYVGCIGDERVAVKLLRASAFESARRLSSFENEVSLLTQAQHPNVVRALGQSMVVLNGQPHPALVMELMPGGSLETYIHHRSATSLPLTPAVQHGFTLDVARGLAHLHSQNVLHRDVKPANILLEGGSTPRAKVADFGVATRSSIEQTAKVGTLRYIAPEVFFGRYTHRADIYSYGLLLWEVVCVERPFSRLSDVAIVTAVTMHNQRPQLGSAERRRGWRTGYLALAAACWDQDPEARPTMNAVIDTLQHTIATLRATAEPLQADLEMVDLQTLEVEMPSQRSNASDSNPALLRAPTTGDSHHTSKLEGVRAYEGADGHIAWVEEPALHAEPPAQAAASV